MNQQYFVSFKSTIKYKAIEYISSEHDINSALKSEPTDKRSVHTKIFCPSVTLTRGPDLKLVLLNSQHQFCCSVRA
jgi:hypothetical protein